VGGPARSGSGNGGVFGLSGDSRPASRCTPLPCASCHPPPRFSTSEQQGMRYASPKKNAAALIDGGLAPTRAPPPHMHHLHTCAFSTHAQPPHMRLLHTCASSAGGAAGAAGGRVPTHATQRGECRHMRRHNHHLRRRRGWGSRRGECQS